MTEEALEALTVETLLFLGVWGALGFAGLRLFHSGRFPSLRWRKARPSQEPALWSGFGVLGCLFLWIFLQAGAIGVAESWAPGWQTGHYLAYLGAELFTLVLVCTFVRQGVGQPLGSLGLRFTPGANYLLTVIAYPLLCGLLVLVALGWSLLLMAVFQELPPPQEAVQLFRDTLDGGDPLEIGLVVAMGVLGAPLSEEVIFRGLLFGWMRQRFGVLAGMVGSSLAFAALHMSLFGLLPLFVLGLFLAYVYQRTRSLYCAMLFHAVFNGVSYAGMFWGHLNGSS